MPPHTRRRLTKWTVIGGVLLLSALDHAGVFGYRGDDRTRYDDATATALAAIDGDTIDIGIPDGNNSATRIRLSGIDCPEIAHTPNDADAYFGREAADCVSQKVVGKQVRLRLDPAGPSRDKYGRLLAYVYLPETGTMLNETLIEQGLAYADRRFQHVMKYRFTQIEDRARKSNAGLWAGVTPELMPAWRQRWERPDER